MINSTTRDEDRNRQNIASLSAVSGQQQIVQDYARKLTDQETQIAKLRDRQTALDKQRAALQTQVDEWSPPSISSGAAHRPLPQGRLGNELFSETRR